MCKQPFGPFFIRILAISQGKYLATLVVGVSKTINSCSGKKVKDNVGYISHFRRAIAKYFMHCLLYL